LAGGEKGTSAWVYVGLGCLLSVLMVVAGVISIGYFGYQKFNVLKKEMTDPVARTAKAKAVLGSDELPNGYYAMASFSIPFVMDMAILSDRRPERDGRTRGIGRWGYVYFRFLQRGRDQEELREYFQGKSADASILRKHNIRLEHQEIIKRGLVELPAERLLYVAQRGDVRMHGSRHHGVTTFILIQCPSDESERMGIWFGPDPSPNKPVGLTDFTNTPADEGAIREFMSHFRPCP